MPSSPYVRHICSNEKCQNHKEAFVTHFRRCQRCGSPVMAIDSQGVEIKEYKVK